MPEILIKKFYTDAVEPSKKRVNDAGWDLYSYYQLVIGPGETTKLDCGVAVWIPMGYAGIIFPRSSWRAQGLVCHSVYDHGYTGLCQPFITNASKSELFINSGERVLQLLFTFVQLGGRIRVVDCLPASDRGEQGAGSTGRF
jgi:dUTP pyrophosphatase